MDDSFTMDLKGYPVAAVRDYGGRVFYHREIFNAGFLVIDNAYWRQEQMSRHLIEMTKMSGMVKVDCRSVYLEYGL